jgi:pilus assembly protein Flp/PilA
MRTVRLFVKNFALDESGQDLIEYALMALLVSLAAVSALSGLAIKLLGLYAFITAAV